MVVIAAGVGCQLREAETLKSLIKKEERLAYEIH